ncbi:UPF0462 protein C4orf33-like isoform X2 [Patiria miniata]|nr:UPF0462 protein C4orf33-like isoform X2 [Patiria miniata]XP_038056741.1 UPF0462 protein C4orf33-like isoform X2 [Patiria miniata]XP_038056742.1 UPF0462 protein C4orf33-like isoform X2 [Patiria miniata]
MESSTQSPTQSFSITHQWDGSSIDHAPIKVSLLRDPQDTSCLLLETEAPFFNNPGRPQGEPGLPYDGLWEYEVVEAFFLGDGEKYLEVELCPHGQHLVLLLNGVRKFYKTKLALDFQATINTDEGTWKGRAKIPLEYLPPGVKKFNAYAIHGSEDDRTYEALYHVPKGQYANPDFHRLEYFRDIDFTGLVSSNIASKLWDNAI